MQINVAAKIAKSVSVCIRCVASLFPASGEFAPVLCVRLRGLEDCVVVRDVLTASPGPYRVVGLALA